MTHSAARDDASLSLTSRTDRSGYVIGALRGELGIATAPALREQLLSLLRAASQLIIDLSAVEHADASGLAVLAGSGRRARLLGGSLRLAAPSPEAARVLSATGLNQYLEIYPTVRTAITGQPRLPGAIFPPATVPARGRIDGVIAGAAAQPAMPAIDLSRQAIRFTANAQFKVPTAGSSASAPADSSAGASRPSRAWPCGLARALAAARGGPPGRLQICLDLSQLAAGVVTADGRVLRASAGNRAPS